MAVRKFSKKNKDGEVCQFWGYDFYDKNGKRHRLTNCKTKGQAENEYKKALEKMGKGELVRENKTLTFTDLVEDFLLNHAKVRCKESTYSWYKRYINKHLTPYFGNMRVININAALVNKFLAIKKEENISNIKNNETESRKLNNKTINHCLVILKAIFSKAVENELISKNPAQKIQKLKTEQKEMFILSQEECFKLLDTAQKYYPDLYPILFTAIFTGMREGEILGLTWDNIDFKKKKITVNKSVYDGKLTTTKTASSNRKVDMTDTLTEVLQTQKRKNKILTKLVFPNNVGNPLCVHNLLHRRFYPCIKKSGIDKNIRFHDLRHTYVSLLISQNVPMKYIQNQVGHSSINTTMNTYGHLLPDVHENAIKILDNISVNLNSDRKAV